MSWSLAGKIYQSRLLLGTAGFPDLEKLSQAITLSGCEICTVAVRRVNLEAHSESGLLPLLKSHHLTILPNTAGCYTAKEAELTTELASSALQTKLVKLEVIQDPYHLLPNGPELLKAAKALVAKGFAVMAYALDDPSLCQELFEIGCVAVMPMGSPIGSGQGILHPKTIEEIRKRVKVPLIIDAGIGTASDVAKSMELGCDAVLTNTAIAKAKDSGLMAHSMKLAIEAGQLAYAAGRIPEKTYATPSSPMEGRIAFGERGK